MKWNLSDFRYAALCAFITLIMMGVAYYIIVIFIDIFFPLSFSQ